MCEDILRTSEGSTVNPTVAAPDSLERAADRFGLATAVLTRGAIVGTWLQADIKIRERAARALGL